MVIHFQFLNVSSPPSLSVASIVINLEDFEQGICKGDLSCRADMLIENEILEEIISHHDRPFHFP